MTLGKKIAINSVALLSAGVMMLGVVSPAAAHDRMDNHHRSVQTTASTDTEINSKIDKFFIVRAVAYDQETIALAQVAVQRSQRTEIQTFAQNVTTNRTAEIAQMQSWYKTWYGTDVPVVTSKRQQADINRLQNAKDFDKAFIRMMISRDRFAVISARHLARHTQRPEMKQLAANIISTQTSELQQLRTWYQQWYR